MRVFSLNLGYDTVMNYIVSTKIPTSPTAENYRFDIPYNRTLIGSDTCVIDYYDTDIKDWASLAGTQADVLLLSLVLSEPEFNNVNYVYYSLSVENNTESELIDVTPTIKGIQDVTGPTGKL